MFLSTIVDIIAFSAAFTIILTSISRCKKVVLIQIFIVSLLIEGIFVTHGGEMFSLMLLTTVEAFIIYRQDKRLYYSLFSALLTVILLTIEVIIMAIMLSAFLQQDGIYHYLMSFFAVFYACFCRLMIRRYLPRRAMQNDALLIIMNAIGMVIMIFISVIAPLFLLYSKETLPFYILFTFFLVFIAAFFVYAIKTETEKHRQEYNRFIEKQYEEINLFRHYYGKLYRSMNYYIIKKDINKISEIFNQYITPEHKEHIENGIDYEMLALVKLPLINGLLYDMVTSLQKKHITYHLHIESIIATENIKEADLFRILTNFIDNAIQETETQENGYINIFMSESKKGTTIRIENTLKSEINISLIYKKGYTTKEKHAGLGLTEARRITDSYSNISLLTYIEFNLFKQYITIE